MEMEVTKVRVTRQGRGVRTTTPEIHFTRPDGRDFTLEVDEYTAREFERLVVRATPMEKL